VTRHRIPKRRLLAALAAVSVAGVLLSGCVQWFQPQVPDTTSTPTDEDVDAALTPFYSQVLVWAPCGDGMQCTTATAPMNWKDPAQASIDLALVRQPATGDKKGSLLVNPGGPGGSGYDFVMDSVDYATSQRLQQSFDIVGFDPRGVGRSSAVSCYDDPAYLDHFNYDPLPGAIGSDEWVAALTALNKDFGEKCKEFTGDLLQYVDTVSAARDLDLLRAVLGDKKLNYLGYSYGTFLGATYAELYPGKTGRLVLDGAIDPATTDFDVTMTQAKGFDSALKAYLTDCVKRDGCPFRAGVGNAMASIARLFDSLQASPLTGEDGRVLGASAMFAATILPLYNQDNWPYLDQLFDEVPRGETQTAFLLADSYNERNADGTYGSNSTEAFLSINCLDYEGDTTDVTQMRAEAAELAAVAPVFGPRMAYGGLTCSQWPYPPTRVREPIAAAGSADILVVGTTNDPATPYVWAQALSKELENGHLITYHGEGHTAYNKSNRCVDDAVDDYFIDGTVPAQDPDC
jgi:pimeloyl-ACP methyl ester carboxylesterase